MMRQAAIAGILCGLIGCERQPPAPPPATPAPKVEPAPKKPC